MTQPAFNYELSYFQPGKESSLVIKINTQGEQTNGFQFIADIKSTPSIDIVDQNQELELPQLSIADIPELSYLTNKVIKTSDGYQIVLAAITSNPKETYSTNQDVTIASLIFTQPSDGELIISQDNQLTKISTVSSTESQNQEVETITTTSQPQTIKTTPVGTSPTILKGEIYSPPAGTEIITDSFQNNQTPKSGSIPTNLIVIGGVIISILIAFIVILLRKLSKNKPPKPEPKQNIPQSNPNTQSTTTIQPTPNPTPQPTTPTQSAPNPVPQPPTPPQSPVNPVSSLNNNSQPTTSPQDPNPQSLSAQPRPTNQDL